MKKLCAVMAIVVCGMTMQAGEGKEEKNNGINIKRSQSIQIPKKQPKQSLEMNSPCGRGSSSFNSPEAGRKRSPSGYQIAPYPYDLEDRCP